MVVADAVYTVVAAAAIGIVIVLAEETPRVREPVRSRNVAIGQMAAALATMMLMLLLR